MGDKCKVPDCEQDRSTRGYCQMHYKRVLARAIPALPDHYASEAYAASKTARNRSTPRTFATVTTNACNAVAVSL